MVSKIAPRSRKLPIDPVGVIGWGIDADLNNDPTYPYRIRTESGGKPMDWARPTLQRTDVEILQSVEYNRRPAVVGTTLPPKGASGRIRRAAFDYSESDWRHWLLLLGADRVDVVEGLVEDLARGQFPNFFAEMGLRAEWRHNRGGFIQKATLAAGALVLGYLLLHPRTARPRSVARPRSKARRVRTKAGTHNGRLGRSAEGRQNRHSA